jgi:hypothetical protein
MANIHQINKDGPIAIIIGTDEPDKDIQTSKYTTFDPPRFRRLLLKWIIEDNIHFSQVESLRFRELLEYTNPSVLESGSLPTHTTIRQ